MIAYIDGKLTFKSPALVHLDVQGLGYEVQISLHTYARIQHLDRCKLLTFLHIKEDAHTLYGFFEEDERTLFLQLLGVSGVGASTARMILSSLKPGEVKQAIAREDEKLLERIKGIGAKTAKRIILELKDKVQKSTGSPSSGTGQDNTPPVDALNALLALGIARPAAERAVQKVTRSFPENQDLEWLIKEALKNV
jgi:Holliday junction DNA helicase RuvA